MITIEIFTPNKQFKKNNLWGTETYINQNFSSRFMNKTMEEAFVIINKFHI